MNIGLSFDLPKAVLKKPTLPDKIPNGTVVEFVEKDFPKKEATILKKRKYIRVKNFSGASFSLCYKS